MATAQWQTLDKPEQPAYERGAVHSPEHYNQGDIECIDALRSALGDSGFIAFCRGNVIKYVWRVVDKGAATTDAEKAAVYLQWMQDALNNRPLTKRGR